MATFEERVRRAMGNKAAGNELLNRLGLPATTGSIFYVDSVTGSNTTNDGLSSQFPLATVDAAINKCTANKGDVVIVMSKHAESFTAADGFDADVAGITIVGLGWGDFRPTFTFADTDATVAVGAASVRLSNLRFVGGISAVVVGVNVEAAGVACWIDNCEWYWGGTTGYDFVQSLNINVGAHRARVENCRFLAEPAVAGASTAIQLVGAVHNVRVQNCEFMGDYSLACMSGITTLSQGLMFLDNLVHNTDASEPYIEMLTGTTGVIANTRGLASGGTVAANAVADAMAHCENFVVNTTGTIAIVKGAGGSPALDVD